MSLFWKQNGRHITSLMPNRRVIISGETIRRELDFQTRVRVLASTSIPLETSATKKTHETMEDVLSER